MNREFQENTVILVGLLLLVALMTGMLVNIFKPSQPANKGIQQTENTK